MMTPVKVTELQRGSTHHPGAVLLPAPVVTPGAVPVAVAAATGPKR